MTKHIIMNTTCTILYPIIQCIYTNDVDCPKPNRKVNKCLAFNTEIKCHVHSLFHMFKMWSRHNAGVLLYCISSSVWFSVSASVFETSLTVCVFLWAGVGSAMEGGRGRTGTKLFQDFQMLSRIWTHPWCLQLDYISKENKVKETPALHLNPSLSVHTTCPNEWFDFFRQYSQQ